MPPLQGDFADAPPGARRVKQTCRGHVCSQSGEQAMLATWRMQRGKIKEVSRRLDTQVPGCRSTRRGQGWRSEATPEGFVQICHDPSVRVADSSPVYRLDRRNQRFRVSYCPYRGAMICASRTAGATICRPLRPCSRPFKTQTEKPRKRGDKRPSFAVSSKYVSGALSQREKLTPSF